MVAGRQRSTPWRIALFAGAGLFALFILAAVALVLFVDVNAHKPRLEAAASDSLRMEVRIGGRLGIGLIPGFHVTLEDVRIRNRGADVASAKETLLGIELLPLLHKEVRIVQIGVKRPRISIEQDRDGRFNFETPEEEAGTKTVEEANGKGCAMVRQTIRGPFRKPEVEKVSVLQSVAGPVLKVFKQAEKLLGGKCEVFYAGSVAPPN